MPLKLVSKKKNKTEPTRRMLFTYEGKKGEGDERKWVWRVCVIMMDRTRE